MWRFYYTIARNIIRLPKIILTMRQKAEHPELYSEEECYEYIKYVVNIMKRTGHIHTEGFGMEHLPKEGGYMLYPNHQGKYDGYGIVAVHEKPCTIVMDEAKSHIIFVREIIDMLKGKRLDIHNARKAMPVINQIAKEVAEGRKCILFPEGGYSKGKKNTLEEFKPGCFKIVLKSKVPIVPVVLIDSYKVFNSWQLGNVKTQVHFLEPIYYDEYKNMKTVEISEMVKGRIQEKLDNLTKTIENDIITS